MFKFLCGLEIIVQLEETEMFVKVFVKVKNLKILSKCFEYELHLKPYAKTYSEFKKQKKILKQEEAKELSEKLCKDTTQFHNMDIENQKLISPYLPLENEKEGKFRRYLENDDYHTCIEDDEFDFNGQWDFEDSAESQELVNQEEDDENRVIENLEKKDEKKEEKIDSEAKCPKNCRIFRNIDKLRIIESSMEEIANINLIKKHPEFTESLYLRNYIQYKDRMTNR